MRSQTRLVSCLLLLSLSVLLLSLALGGCQSGEVPASKATVTTRPTTAPADAQLAGAAGKGGAQLWSENCSRCHNMRDPSTYNSSQWEVVVHHMRVRAGLTAEESKKIVEFLKSAS